MAAEPEPTFRERQKVAGRNFVHGLKESRVKKVFISGLHLAVVNTVGAFTTEFLNFYLENRGLNQRRMTIMSVPNPDKDTPHNPLRRKMM